MKQRKDCIDGTETYMSTELNMVDKSMKEIFGLSADAQASPELENFQMMTDRPFIMKQ